MEILLLGQHIIKNILQHQQFAKRLAELLRTHPDLFISDDVCCHSQPRFDEAAKLFHKLGRVVALIMVHLQITANVITDEGIWIGSKSSAKLLTSGWCRRIFL